MRGLLWLDGGDRDSQGGRHRRRAARADSATRRSRARTVREDESYRMTLLSPKWTCA